MTLRPPFLRAWYPLLALIVSWSAASATWADGSCPCEGDVTGDGFINVTDFAIVILCAEGDCSLCVNSCDVNCDGVVDLLDVYSIGCSADDGSDCCNGPTGACRGAKPPLPGCVVTTQALCENTNVSGAYEGDGTDCVVPALSEWGLAAFALLLLTAGSILARSRVTAGA